MEYSPKAIANYFLDLGDRDGVEISPMKVQKLVYYAQAWYLGLTEPDNSLVNEQVECWPYGPVFDSLFHEFKEFGNDPITRRAESWDFVTGSDGNEFLAQLTPNVPEDATVDRAFLDSVWDLYSKYSAIKLSNMTHEEGGPWHTIYTDWEKKPPRGTDIPRELIREYFARLAQSEG